MQQEIVFVCVRVTTGCVIYQVNLNLHPLLNELGLFLSHI